MSKKQFGLILPKSKAAGGGNVQKATTSKAFNDSSDDDAETEAVVSGGTDWMKKKLSSKSSVNAKSGATGVGTKLKAQTKIELQKALEEDPSVFQYDEVYDQMEAAKVEQLSQKKEKDRKPRYIASLLKHAEIRTKENERRIERQVQKEREAEGDQFADKEKFVTSAYRKKMEELQKLEEEDRKKDAIENLLDVTKQKDMSGFYRHLYRQTMGDEKGQKVIVKEEPSELDEKNDVEDESVTLSKKTKPSQRSYRRRDSEKAEDEDGDQEDQKGSQNSAESSGDNDDGDVATKETEEKRMEKDKKRREELRRKAEARERRKRRIAEGRDTSSEEENDDDEDNSDEEEKDDKDKSADTSENKENTVSNAKPTLSAAKKPKLVDIWKKVTVGNVFEDALQRYLERKADRGSRFPW